MAQGKEKCESELAMKWFEMLLFLRGIGEGWCHLATGRVCKSVFHVLCSSCVLLSGDIKLIIHQWYLQTLAELPDIRKTETQYFCVHDCRDNNMTGDQKWSQSISVAPWWLACFSGHKPHLLHVSGWSNNYISKMVSFILRQLLSHWRLFKCSCFCTQGRQRVLEQVKGHSSD